MKLNRLHLTAAILLTLISVQGLFAQNTSSPYSRFGYGLLNDNATATQRQMGGIGYGMNSGRQINAMNPASYAFIDSLTYLFDMGINYTSIKRTEGDAKENTSGGGLDYITMQFPVSKRIGMSIGLLPYSSVGYAFGSEIENGLYSRQGSGGLNQLYAGIAGRILDGLSVGVNASYLFGNVINDAYATAESGSEALFEQVTSVRDWHIQAGVQYSFNVGRKNRFTLGAVYSPEKTLLGHAWVTQYDVTADTEPIEHQRVSLRNNAGLPETWGGGINYTWDNRFMVEADYTYQPWSKVKVLKLEGFDQNNFADRWQISLGSQFTPAERGSYLRRVSYRVGGFFNNDYIMVGTNRVREYGLSCGFGLPTLGRTIVNLGFEYRHRQAHPNPLLKENYFSVRLGLNLNEIWFQKSKIK